MVKNRRDMKTWVTVRELAARSLVLPRHCFFHTTSYTPVEKVKKHQSMIRGKVTWVKQMQACR
jgi:hypothetical protein